MLTIVNNVIHVDLLVQEQRRASFIYPAISTFAVQICYTNKFLLYSY
jgi:hypothetical protein